MATTKRNANLIEEHRKRIQTTKLLDRLSGHALAQWKLIQTFAKDGKKIKKAEIPIQFRMSDSQIRAAKILLDKALPSLVSQEIHNAPDAAAHAAPPRPRSFEEFVERSAQMGHVVSINDDKAVNE